MLFKDVSNIHTFWKSYLCGYKNNLCSAIISSFFRHITFPLSIRFCENVHRFIVYVSYGFSVRIVVDAWKHVLKLGRQSEQSQSTTEGGIIRRRAVHVRLLYFVFPVEYPSVAEWSSRDLGCIGTTLVFAYARNVYRTRGWRQYIHIFRR